MFLISPLLPSRVGEGVGGESFLSGSKTLAQQRPNVQLVQQLRDLVAVRNGQPWQSVQGVARPCWASIQSQADLVPTRSRRAHLPVRIAKCLHLDPLSR